VRSTAIGLAALLAVALGAITEASAHHLKRFPKQSDLARVYPDLVVRTKADPQGFTWHRFDLRAHSRWRSTHPAAEKAHRRLVERARRQAEERRLRNQGSSRESMWRKVASCESGGNWAINTGNGYYGGLQMDESFQRTYGPEFYSMWGTADNWPASAQMRAADRAYESRGLGPWPECGEGRLGHRPVS
jgi:hypothetical protein